MTGPARAVALILVTLLVAVLAGCGPEGGDDVDGAAAKERLERQRAEVREVSSTLIEAVERDLRGHRTQVSGRYRGCESGGLEHFESFRYTLDARIDAGAAAERPYARVLSRTLEDRGLDPETEQRTGVTLLRASTDAVDVLVTERPEAGDFVLVSVGGPCVDVPEEQSDHWLGLDEQEPLDG